MIDALAYGAMIACMFTTLNAPLRLAPPSDPRTTPPAGLNEPRVVACARSLAASDADRGLAFAQLAREWLGRALVRCEERYPQVRSRSVLVVVVERDPAQWRETLNSLHAQLFGCGKTPDTAAPPRLEVIDRATDEAIQRLMAAGLIGKTTRASRPLFPLQSAAGAVVSDTGREQAAAHRVVATHKLRLARTLGEAGFASEARPVLLDAVHSFGCALALENCTPEPLAVHDAVTPPLSYHWKAALPIIASFVNGTGEDWQLVAAQLASV